MLAALVLNAPELDTEVKEDAIIAADGGYRHVEGKNVIAVIGDLDTLKRIPENVKLIRYPVEKNATDGELAIEYAAASGVKELNIYGGLGGKPEHVLGNLNLLAFAHEKGIRAVIRSRDYDVYFACGAFRATVVKGAAVSVFPHGGEALIDRSEGLYYPLEGLTVAPSSSRGISNVATADEIAFEVKRGAALVFVRRT